MKQNDSGVAAALKAPAIMLFIAILLIDFCTKSWVRESFFVDSGTFPLILWKDFFGISASVTYAVNSGAAWGMFAEFPKLLVFFRVVLISGLIVYLLFYNNKKEWQLPLVCIVSGALGNVLDYFLYGHVIDMIQVAFWGYNYPVFNIADSSIFIGAAWLLVLAFFEKAPSDGAS